MNKTKTPKLSGISEYFKDSNKIHESLEAIQWTAATKIHDVNQLIHSNTIRNMVQHLVGDRFERLSQAYDLITYNTDEDRIQAQVSAIKDEVLRHPQVYNVEITDRVVEYTVRSSLSDTFCYENVVQSAIMSTLLFQRLDVFSDLTIHPSTMTQVVNNNSVQTLKIKTRLFAKKSGTTLSCEDYIQQVIFGRNSEVSYDVMSYVDRAYLDITKDIILSVCGEATFDPRPSSAYFVNRDFIKESDVDRIHISDVPQALYESIMLNCEVFVDKRTNSYLMCPENIELPDGYHALLELKPSIKIHATPILAGIINNYHQRSDYKQEINAIYGIEILK